MTLATVADEGPYCANLFYAWMEAEGAFAVTSFETTLHARQALANPKVAGSVVLETKVIGKLQGVQFRGEMYRPEGDDRKRVRKVYLERFPFAAVMDIELWVIRLTFAKLTDNRLGFGKKIIWNGETNDITG